MSWRPSMAGSRTRSWGLMGGLLCLALAAGGCKRKPTDTPTDKPADKPADKKSEAAAAPAAKTGVLVGTVRMAEGNTELPSYSSEEMERQVLKHAKGGNIPDACSPPKLEDRQPVSLTPDGKLVGVMLAASEFSQSYERGAPKIWNVVIRDCRLQPKMILARIGDTLHIENDSNFPMMPGLGYETYNQTLTKGQTRDIKLDTGGVKILSCGFSGQCGRTDVVVMAHPVNALTNEKGEFRIENFPVGQTVRINAWHPLFFETYQEVRVAPGEEKRVELLLTPKPPPKPPKPVERDPNIISPD